MFDKKRIQLLNEKFNRKNIDDSLTELDTRFREKIDKMRKKMKQNKVQLRKEIESNINVRFDELTFVDELNWTLESKNEHKQNFDS